MELFIIASLSLSALAETPRTGPSVDWSHGPLRVSSNGRFLEHQDGTPFFYLGCTAWELFHRCTREDAELYLDNRRAKGFTVIQAVVIAEIDGLNVPNVYGQKPLTNNDPTTPNEEYFKHVDYIVDLANAKGIAIGMLPTWGRWVNENNIFTTQTARTYGQHLGQRYASKKIIWIMGGDRGVNTDQQNIWRAMAEGIQIGAGGADKALMTFHPPGGQCSSTWFHSDPWLDFNMWQNGHCKDTDVWNRIQQSYNLSPTKPVMDGEPLYEEHPVCFDAPKYGTSNANDIRKYAYWDLFTGAFGHTYGCHAIWQMWAPGRDAINGPKRYWYESLDLDGAWDMMHVRSLMDSRPALVRVPDQTTVTDAYSGADRVQATRGSDYAFVYSATGQAFTVTLGKLSGSKVKGWWYNPRDGAATAIGEFDNTGTRLFTPPSNGYGNDWVLALDDASKNYPPPGDPSAAGRNSPPAVAITAPSPYAIFSSSANVSITAESSDYDGNVAKVEFFQGSTRLGVDATAPYSIAWNRVAAGTYELTAKATDDSGAITTSTSVRIYVTDGQSVLFRAVNLNGPALTIDGNVWEGSTAPNCTYQGQTFENQSITLSPQTDAARAQMIRSSVYGNPCRVTLSSVPPGAYQVFVYSWEDNNSTNFDIALEGSTVQTGHASGNAGRWDKLGPWVTQVTNGTLEVSATGGDANLSGIEVWRLSGLTTVPPQKGTLRKSAPFAGCLIADGTGMRRLVQGAPAGARVIIATVDGRVLVKAMASELAGQRLSAIAGTGILVGKVE